LPVPHRPQEVGVPLQEGSEPPPLALEAKTESFFDSLVEPQLGQGVPSQLLERTRISLSFLHFSQ
jgi:hypothetical protein